jgi:hypothetical protein
MLARFERLMEQAVEGSLRRVFKTTLQPVQIAKAAARAMEQAQVVGLNGREVPNAYAIHLAPVDYERFGDYRATLTAELSQYLTRYAHERELHPVGEPHTELASDDGVRAGTVRVTARFVDVAPERRPALDDAIAGTRRLQLADLKAAAAATESADGALWLEDRLGLRLALEPDLGIVRIGRAADNDAVISSQRVSRYHAQLRWIESAWLVYDLDSTNGTFVDDQRVSSARPVAVRNGSILRVGDHDLNVLRGG